MGSSIYDQKAWVDKFITRQPADAADEARVSVITGMIPSDVKTVLDAGVGGGYIYRRLAANKDLHCFGIDLSRELIGKLGSGKACAGDVSRLPFRSGAFDLVIAADLIEHITDEAFDRTIAELARVAKRYILINSPNCDVVDWPVSRCDRCGREFNIYGHMRTINAGVIRSAFGPKGFEFVKSGTVGARRDPRPLFLVRIARRWGNAYSADGAICPYCLHTDIALPPKNTVQRLVSRAVCGIFYLSDAILPPLFKSRSEMYALLKKSGA